MTAKRLEQRVAHGLRVVQAYPGGIFILRTQEKQSRADLVELGRQLRRSLPTVVLRAGPAVLPGKATVPMILSDEFIVEFKRTASVGDARAILERERALIVMKNPFVKGQFLARVTAETDGDALTVTNRLSGNEHVRFAHPDFVKVVFDRETTPNDPLYASQWHHRNTGVAGGTNDADADTSFAWDLTQGAAATSIAVIDGGFDMTQPDLTPNIAANPGEVPANGVDDDGNGFVDDVNGWDFSACPAAPTAGCGDNNPTGGNHGTSVAGVAAARGNNALGVSGACPNCSLLLIRNGSTDWGQGLAFGYAQARGAAVITNSWGFAIGTPCATNLCNAINAAATNGRGGLGSVVLFAMNNGNRDDCAGTSPDISSLANVIAVSASSNQDRKVTESAWGNCMEVLSPTHRGYGGATPFSGTLNVVTTDVAGAGGYNNTSPVGAACPSIEPAPPPANARDYTLCFGGTSSATPLVAGAAGLVLTANGGLSRLTVQRLLQDTADKIQDSVGAYSTATGFSTPATGPATHGFGRLNAFEAVRVVAPVVRGGRAGVDVFLRDNRLDWGNTEQPSNYLFEPTRGTIAHWESVDIKVDAPPYQPAPTTNAQFEALVDEPPETGDTNNVYVRVRNRGPTTASSATVKLHWTQFGTALPVLPSDFWTAFPADSSDTSQWHPLGAQSLTNLAYSGASLAGCPGRAQPPCGGGSDAAQIAAFTWLGPSVGSGENHFCLLAIVDSAQDRVSTRSRSSFVVDDVTPNDNNVTHRNVAVVDNRSSARFEIDFLVRNPLSQDVRAILVPTLPRGWRMILEGVPLRKPFPLKEQQSIAVRMTVTAPKPGVRATVELRQELFGRGEEPPLIGGLTLRFRPSK